MEYKYPRSLVDRKDIESILAQYVADVTPYARECPVTPSLEERYRDPFAYRIDFIGLEEEGPQEISTELVEIYGGYRITYYETVDTAAGEPYLISYMTARDGDTDKYTRSNATMLIRDLAETRKVWQYYIRDMIDAEPDPDAEPSLEEVLRKRYNIEYSRQSTESKKAKDKERIKAGKCDKYKKKSTITGRGPLIIELCKGEEKDIEIVTDGKVREADGKLVITGQSITIEVLKNTELKITGHVD